MQVDQAAHHCGAFPPLVHPHRPEAEHRFAPVKQSGHLPQTFLGDVAEAGHPPRSPAGSHVEKGVVVFGVVVDERGVLSVLAQHEVGDPVQQRQVTARCDRQVNVGGFGGVGAAWVHHHDFHAAGIAFSAFQQSLEQHRVAVGRVGADQEGHAAVIQILVAARRAVRSQAAGVAGHSRTHAEP